VVAPGRVPRGATDRVKTDRRDALKLARLHRAGALTPVGVPDPEQEAMRDRTRAREDRTALQTKARPRLGAFLLRPGPALSGQEPVDTGPYALARRAVLCESGASRSSSHLPEYVDAGHEAARRVADRDNPIREAAVSGSFAPVVDALIRLRGIDGLSAVTVLAERGDITRFDNPRQLMSFLGLVPSEHASGAPRPHRMPHRCYYQNRQRSHPAHPGGSRRELSLPGTQDTAPRGEGQRGPGTGADPRP